VSPAGAEDGIDGAPSVDVDSDDTDAVRGGVDRWLFDAALCVSDNESCCAALLMGVGKSSPARTDAVDGNPHIDSASDEVGGCAVCELACCPAARVLLSTTEVSTPSLFEALALDTSRGADCGGASDDVVLECFSITGVQPRWEPWSAPRMVGVLVRVPPSATPTGRVAARLTSPGATGSGIASPSVSLLLANRPVRRWDGRQGTGCPFGMHVKM
jgi:hypothetical protein